MLELEIGHESVVEVGREVRFVFEVEYVLELEHSLVTLSKWESKWEKPFIDDAPKTTEEILSYINCMVQTSNYPKNFLSKLTQKNFTDVDNYINAKHSATWFNENGRPAKKSTEKLTAELIYYWISGIQSPPPGYQDWHLNNLFTYIKIHDVKNSKPQKQSTAERNASRREINERNKAAMGTTG